MMNNKNYWSGRYQRGDTGWDIGKASDPLAQYIHTLPDRAIKILIPGAGNSWEADEFLKAGFTNVYLLDFAEAPLDEVRKRLPGIPASHLICDDFFEHKGQYDLVLEQTFFCAIDPSMRAAYARKMFELIKPGGLLAGLLFDCTFPEDGPPWGGSKAEYENYFIPYFDILHMSTAINSIEPRAGRELFIELRRRQQAVVM